MRLHATLSGTGIARFRHRPEDAIQHPDRYCVRAWVSLAVLSPQYRSSERKWFEPSSVKLINFKSVKRCGLVCFFFTLALWICGQGVL
jgi:hypothetical protein